MSDQPVVDLCLKDLKTFVCLSTMSLVNARTTGSVKWVWNSMETYSGKNKIPPNLHPFYCFKRGFPHQRHIDTFLPVKNRGELQYFSFVDVAAETSTLIYSSISPVISMGSSCLFSKHLTLNPNNSVCSTILFGIFHL